MKRAIIEPVQKKKMNYLALHVLTSEKNQLKRDLFYSLTRKERSNRRVCCIYQGLLEELY